MDPLRTPFLPPTPALVSLALFLARGPPLRDELPIQLARVACSIISPMRVRVSRFAGVDGTERYTTAACWW